MSIKVWDYLDEFEAEREDIFAGIEKVFRSGRLILGESVKNFESAFSAYCGVRYGVGVDNATNGLFLALKALGIGPGDEVITVSNTAVPTVAAIRAAGATPRFVDIEPGTYLMDVQQLEGAVTPKTRCIMPVHLFGQCADMQAVNRVAQRHGLKVVEDCSQAHGAAQNGRRAGSMSDLGVFSFYPTKPLGGYGDGGIVVTNQEPLAAKLRRLRFYGMDNVYYAEEDGYNSRLDEIHAEILLRKLKRLDQYIARRQELAMRYDEILGHTSLVLPRTAPGNVHVYYIYVGRHPERDRIIAELGKRDIHVNISYPWPIHIMRGYKCLGYKDFPQVEKAAKEIFSLPMYPSLSDEAVEQTCLALGESLGQKVKLPKARES
jgi:aminotransferase EvaB